METGYLSRREAISYIEVSWISDSKQDYETKIYSL
jgi:hypothetical protein